MPAVLVLKAYEVLALLLGFFSSFLPARDTSGEMLHILVTKLLSGFRSLFVSHALWPAAICDDQRILVFRQQFRELFAACLEIDRARNAALFEGLSPVHIDHSNLLVSD